MASETTQIDLGCSDNRLWLRIRGPAVQAAALTLNRLADDYLAAHPSAPAIAVDLSPAPWIDSTIAGWLLKLAGRVSAANGSLLLTGCSDVCRQSFERMRIAGLFQSHDLPPPREWQTLDCTAAAPTTFNAPTRDAIQLMADAHAALAALDEENQRIFGPIAEMLKKQLG